MTARPATLDDLAGVWIGADIRGDASTVVGSITHDSRRVTEGTLFCCVPGSTVDGHDFAPAALAAGAAALLVQRPLDLLLATGDLVPQLVVDDVRTAMGPIAARVFADPSRSIDVVGVTGTNGKTSVVQLIGHLLASSGHPVRTLGTLTGPRTTPEAPELQATLATARDEGATAVAMEVSSHALTLHRVDGTRFRVGVFTNLGRDHLDFHGTLEAYEAAKSRLFTSEFVETAVINTDDVVGRRIADRCDVPVRTYGLADVDDLEIDGPISRFRWHGHEVVLRLPGSHNVLNALAAALVAVELGLEPVDIADGLCSAESARGRFEMVSVGQPYSVVVDYAHKPEALQAVLVACRQIVGVRADGSPGRVIVVFGCGGDRDPFKRPVMGQIAASFADRVVLTSDNPRSEDPESILDAIVAGVPAEAADRVDRIEDRAEAIAAALGRAEAGDVVLIAGKGDEVYQIVGNVTLPFDDREVVVRTLIGGGAR